MIQDRTQILVNGRVVGDIENGIYVSKRKTNHLMWKYQGFGMSEELLLYLKKNGIKTTKIIYDETKFFVASVEEYLKSDKTHIFIHPDGKKDKQYFLSGDDMWSKNK